MSGSHGSCDAACDITLLATRSHMPQSWADMVCEWLEVLAFRLGQEMFSRHNFKSLSE